MTRPGIFAAPGPRWFTIAAHRSFVDDLAQTLFDQLTPQGPEALTDAVLLVPTRRGARSLAEAFLRAGHGAPVLLPQIRAVGDLEEGEPPFEAGDLAADLAPAVSPLRRRFELARLIVEHAPPDGRDLDAAGALEMADALAGFLDSLQIEEVADPSRIETLVEADFAEHWRRSVKFLGVAVRRWPQRLAELGLLDPVARRVILLRRLAEQWDAQPPSMPLIAAGSTGTAPATAALLGVVARAPRGCVVLPGLDLNLAADAWAAIDDQHPQISMKRLLDGHRVGRGDARFWPGSEPASTGDRAGHARQRLVNEALRPAEATKDWLDQIAILKREAAETGVDPIAEGLSGLASLSMRTEEEVAAVAAILLREVLETPGKTCALVTPDAILARRVSARLSRWGVKADSSAGAPLAESPIGVLMGLVAQASADPVSPAVLLALLKHPLVRLGREAGDLVSDANLLERLALRGPRARDRNSLLARLRAPGGRDATPESLGRAEALAHDLFAALTLASAPFDELGARACPADSARVLVQAIEALARGLDGATGGLWSGGAGEAAAELLAGIIQDGAVLPGADARGFQALIDELMTAEAVRTTSDAHPRLKILGAIEARLVRADRVVLGGLEEGVWPRGAPVDPFLSRPMRKALGLPSPERRVGLSAHDFVQAACAPEVFLLHAERRSGQPTVKSRWLWRLETLARGAGAVLPGRPEILAWARALDGSASAPPLELRPAPRPEPRPPVTERPSELPVTGVETWVRDPYAVYARHVLGLRQLSPPDEQAEARLRGTAIHAAMEIFAETWRDDANAGSCFADLYLSALRKAGVPEPALAREQVLAERAGDWLAEFERRRRADGAAILTEAAGKLTLARAEGRSFLLTARADRLEAFGGRLSILDFKTGRPPSKKEVEIGFSPQLTLTAAIAFKGGFERIGSMTPGDLTYVRISGREPPGEEVVRGVPEESLEMALSALDGLQTLIARYDDPSYPYRSRTAPRFVKAHVSDYDHLARVREWSAAGEDEEGE